MVAPKQGPIGYRGRIDLPSKGIANNHARHVQDKFLIICDLVWTGEDDLFAWEHRIVINPVRKCCGVSGCHHAIGSGKAIISVMLIDLR